VAYVGILNKQRTRLENLSEAWRERAEQIGRQKLVVEDAVVAHQVRSIWKCYTIEHTSTRACGAL